jgi:hypothetical protein
MYEISERNCIEWRTFASVQPLFALPLQWSTEKESSLEAGADSIDEERFRALFTNDILVAPHLLPIHQVSEVGYDAFRETLSSLLEFLETVVSDQIHEHLMSPTALIDHVGFHRELSSCALLTVVRYRSWLLMRV